jgi:hypothetical protein
MNQRITKLVRQALNECVSTPVESVIASRIDDHGIVEIPNVFSEKFAELMIEEMRNILTDVYRETPLECAVYFLRADEQIMKHFYGIEE